MQNCWDFGDFWFFGEGFVPSSFFSVRPYLPSSLGLEEFDNSLIEGVEGVITLLSMINLYIYMTHTSHLKNSVSPLNTLLLRLAD